MIHMKSEDLKPLLFGTLYTSNLFQYT